MNKSISVTLAALLFCTIAGIAQLPSEKTNIKKLSIPGFEKLTVNANIDVELVQDESVHEAYIQGDQKLAEGIKVSVSGDNLIVESKYPRTSYKGKLVVSIPVAQLKALQVNSNSLVTTVNIINAPRLLLTINGECEVKLQTNGKIVCAAVDPYDYAYEYRLGDHRMSIEGQ